MPPPGNKHHVGKQDITSVILFTNVKLTKNPAQNGHDCLTRAEEVKAMLVNEKARTMAPRPRWHSPRYRSSRAPPGPRPEMPRRLSDQPLDPEAEATLLESEGEGMLGLVVERRQDSEELIKAITPGLGLVTPGVHRSGPEVLRRASWGPCQYVQELCQCVWRYLQPIECLSV